MVTDIEAKKAFDMAGGKCLLCGRLHVFEIRDYELHHIYWKSEYKGTDRDDAWNLAILCGSLQKGWDCHKFEPNTPHMSKGIDRQLKVIADIRKPLEFRSFGVTKDLIQKRKSMKNQYKKNIENFKAKNGGLSPSQVNYRRQKAYQEAQKNKTID